MSGFFLNIHMCIQTFHVCTQSFFTKKAFLLAYVKETKTIMNRCIRTLKCLIYTSHKIFFSYETFCMDIKCLDAHPNIFPFFWNCRNMFLGNRLEPKFISGWLCNYFILLTPSIVQYGLNWPLSKLAGALGEAAVVQADRTCSIFWFSANHRIDWLLYTEYVPNKTAFDAVIGLSNIWVSTNSTIV
jgi:hypothetical protein